MGDENNPLKHTVSVLDFLRLQTDTVILFYSGGKDSLVLLDILYKNEFKIYLAFMYFIPDLYHIEKYIDWAVQKYQVYIKKYQHWMISHYFNDNFFRLHTEVKMPIITLSDIEKRVKLDFKCEWVINGCKQNDSLHRRIMLRQLFLESIELKSHRVYPLSKWSKQNCIQYIKQYRLPVPINYGSATNSSGLDLKADILRWVQKNYPDDLVKILNVFPLAETLLWQ